MKFPSSSMPEDNHKKFKKFNLGYVLFWKKGCGWVRTVLADDRLGVELNTLDFKHLVTEDKNDY
jgi:hypothetical protein